MTQRTTRLVFLGILLLAVFARTWRITTMPGGLFPDQAANGEDALSILAGDLQPFYERGNGREALFFYLQAGMIALFGVGVWPLFLASALVGIATVWATTAAGTRVFGTTVGLLSGLMLAANPWHVTLSRTGFRAILVPLAIALTVLFLSGIVRARTPRGRILHGLGAGAAFGLGWYTYIAFRVFSVVLALLTVILFFFDARRRPRFLWVRRFGGSLVVAGLAAALVLAPLGIYFARHPAAFVGRAGHVSVLNPDLHRGDVAGTIVDVARDSVLAFFTRGDENPRHNVPGAPLLSPIPAMLFLVGLSVAIVRSGQAFRRALRGRRPGGTMPFFAVLLLALFMLAPAVATAEGIPHGLRLIGEIPAVFWLAGVGGAWVLHRFRHIPSRVVRQWSPVIVGALLALTVAYELVLYFGVAANDPNVWREYRSDLTTVSAYLVERHAWGKPPAFLALDAFSEQTVHFLTTEAGTPYVLVRPEDSHAASLGEDDVIVFTQSSLPDAARYAAEHPDAREVRRATNPFGQTTMVVYGRE